MSPAASTRFSALRGPRPPSRPPRGARPHLEGATGGEAAARRLRPPRAGAPSARSRDSRETRGLGSAPPRPRGALLARLQQGRPDMAEGRVSGGPRGKARGGAGTAGRPTGPCGSRPGVVARGAAGLRGGPFQPVGARRAGVLSAAPEATPLGRLGPRGPRRLRSRVPAVRRGANAGVRGAPLGMGRAGGGRQLLGKPKLLSWHVRRPDGLGPRAPAGMLSPGWRRRPAEVASPAGAWPLPVRSL